MNIYIIVEIKKREFLSRFLLALEAALNGHTVYLGNIVQLLDKNLLKPGIIHHKSLTPNKKRISQLKNLRERNFLITSQDEEVGHVNIHAKEYVSTRYGGKTIKLVDYLFTWGKFDYNNLLNKYPNFKNKIINAGNPRVDFWRTDFKKFYNKEKKNYFLISSNFENIFGETNFYQKYKFLKESKYFDLGMSEKRMLRRMTIEAILVEKYINLLKKLSKIFPKKNFLLRPHPIENPKHWNIIFENYKNIKVDQSGNLSEVLNNADIVLHNGCTGGLEAAIRQIPTISYMPIKETIGHPIANKLSLICKNELSLINEIKKIYNTKKKYRIKNLALKERNLRFENILNIPAYKKIIKIWNKIDKESYKEKNNDFLINLFFQFKKLRKNISLKPYINPKFNPISKKEVFNLKDKFERINPKYKNLSIKILSEDLIKFEYEKK